eukprot:1136913-Pelagomonas_calceolata.AAC.3
MHESALFRDVFHSPFLARGVSKMGSALLGTCTHCGLVTERAAASAPCVKHNVKAPPERTKADPNHGAFDHFLSQQAGGGARK